MPRLRKYHANNTTLFITTSVEQGLMLNSNPLCTEILLTSMARAQTLHPIKIAHYLIESTHMHMIAYVDNPDDVKGFMERFKTETATRLNIVLGRKKRTIWCEGYDSTMLATVDKVIEKIAYIYSNPAKDNLEDCIENFPGLNSWNMFLANESTKLCPYIRRSEFRALSKEEMNIKGFKKEAYRLVSVAKEFQNLKLYFNDWMRGHNINSEKAKNEINLKIVEEVRKLEQKYREERKVKKKKVFGKEALNSQLIETKYLPNRSGKRTWCLCDDIPLRKQIISHIKSLVEKAKEVYEKWKCGDYSVSFPLGLYPPSFPKIAEPVYAY
jgi:REP element-mobilizing transposase RayT